MGKLTVLIMCSFFYEYADLSATYDQRQTGDLNVQVDFKDIQIIALMNRGKEEYVDYDYAYDYAEMTIKPPNGTNIKPLNITGSVTETANNTTASTTVFIEQTTESMTKNETLVIADAAETTLNPIINNTKIDNMDFSTTTASGQDSKNVTSLPSMINNCKKGFVRNDKGNCVLKMQGSSNALLNIVKLAQKLKLRRQNRKAEEIV